MKIPDQKCVYPFPIRHRPNKPMFHKEPKLLNAAERREILAFVEGDRWIRNDHKHEFVEQKNIYPDEMPWLYKRVADTFMLANDQFWRVGATGLYEPIRVARYSAGNGASAHVDYSPWDNSKLGMIVPLNDPRSYGGGFVNFPRAEWLRNVEGVPYDPFRPAAGDAVIFPGWEVHEVSKVTSGMRYVLLAWAAGPDFT